MYLHGFLFTVSMLTTQTTRSRSGSGLGAPGDLNCSVKVSYKPPAQSSVNVSASTEYECPYTFGHVADECQE